MKKVLFAAMMFWEAALSSLLANMHLIDEIAARDKAADDAVAAIRTSKELAAKQAAWRAWWLDALGEMPARTPLNARVVSRAEFDGFRLENIVFESQPGVYVTAHLALPMRPRGSAALPHVVLMPLGHSDAGILNPRYAAHLAMAARAGFAAFAWDPISQGERRQAWDKNTTTRTTAPPSTRASACVAGSWAGTSRASASGTRYAPSTTSNRAPILTVLSSASWARRAAAR